MGFHDREESGMNAALAERIRDTLHVHSLEELEAAANDGRLAAVH